MIESFAAFMQILMLSWLVDFVVGGGDGDFRGLGKTPVLDAE